MIPLSILFADPIAALETSALLLGLLCLSIQIVGTSDEEHDKDLEENQDFEPDTKQRLLAMFEVGTAISMPKRCLAGQQITRLH
ncbi:MAG: hypothetical protein KDD66_14505 [Bdellovibrionales bacterium]|nr:hypothetical protein [Bdellovibrionales bacterium]